MTKQRLGIIQTRGLGDIIIALPIAKYYYDQNWEIYWPITDAWVEQMTHAAPWVKWIPISPDPGPFFYDIPLQRLKNFRCDEIIPLYQALTGQEFHKETYFQHTGFDQYKYIRAGVPFINKWQLASCITRDPQREQALYDRKVGANPYVVTHLDASGGRTQWDESMVPTGWDIIEITPEGYIFDWLKIIEGAESIVMTDSCMANLVDQLNIDTDRYFIPIHHIGLTPVQGNYWCWLANPRLDPKSNLFGIQ
jgi:hypothetical protein